MTADAHGPVDVDDMRDRYDIPTLLERLKTNYGDDSENQWQAAEMIESLLWFKNEATEALRDVEWVDHYFGNDGDSTRECPYCEMNARQGHLTGCKLAELIGSETKGPGMCWRARAALPPGDDLVLAG